ncbi:MAG: hypothetical protein GY821_06780 [Gammaproteobacteria bacterium]|nr:hypothetical protein [Gammaproteobacteria bacterium]
MRLLLRIVIVLIIAVVVGLEIKHDPGYMLIYFRHWTMELPLWLAVVLLLLIIWLVQFIWRAGYLLFHRHGRLRSWHYTRDLRQTQQQLRDAWWALLHGHWRRAEKLFIADDVTDKHTLTNYLAAARAAHEQGAIKRRDQYLAKAYKSEPKHHITIALSEAELALAQQQPSRALAILHPLVEQAAKQPRLVKQLYPLYLHAHDWDDLLNLLPIIKKQKLLAAEAIETLEISCYSGKLALAEGDVPQLRRLWQRVPLPLRQKVPLINSYASALIKAHGDDEALSVVMGALRKGWDDALAQLFATIRATDSDKQLKQAQGLLKLHGQRGLMLLVVAKLTIRCQQWGQAKTLLQRAIDNGVDREAYTQLGFVYQQLGDATRACQSYQQGANLP